MNNTPASDDSKLLQMSIQQSLQDIAVQMGHPVNERTAKQLYQESVELLDHISYAPITLARVAGTLLVYQVQQELEPEEPEWFKSQVQQCSDDTEVEELIESLHRTDALCRSIADYTIVHKYYIRSIVAHR